MLPRFVRSLRFRLLVLFATVAVGPLLTIGVFDYFRSRHLVEQLVGVQTDTIVRHALAALEERYAVVASDVLLYSENREVQTYLDIASGTDSAASRPAQANAKIFLDGVAQMTRPTYSAVELRDRSGRPWYTQANYSGPSGGVNASPEIVVPIRSLRNRGEVGSLHLTPRSDAIASDEVMGLPFGRTGYTVVVDRKSGAIIRAVGDTKTARTVAGLLGLSSAVAISRIGGPTGRFRFDSRGETRMASFASLDAPALTILSATALDEFSGTFARQRAIDLAFLSALGGVAAVAFVVLIRRTTRSLEDLTRAAAVVGRGDLSPSLPPATLDEVGTLSAAFAEMTDRIQSMMREVEVSRQLAVLGEFAAHLSHEIRNPLTSLKLDLQGLQRGVKSGVIAASAQPSIDTCLREVNRLNAVARGVLELARGEAPERRSCCVLRIVDDAIGTLATQVHDSRIEIERDIVVSRSEVLGDSERLTSAFVNLLLNAVEAQPNGGGILIRARDRSTDFGEMWLDVTVADGGSGVRTEMRDTLFLPFKTSKRGGTGLGLALTLQTAREHHGHIALVESLPGYPGAAFTMSLPLIVP